MELSSLLYASLNIESSLDNILSIAGIILTIAGIILTMAQMIHSKNKLQIRYATSTNKIKDLRDIFFNNTILSDLAITKIAFWNSGNKPIDKSNMVSIYPFTICGNKQLKILDVKILYQVEVANQFKIEFDNNTARIDFEYIGKLHGIIIQVMSTGEGKIRITGMIKDGKRIKDISKPQLWLLRKNENNIKHSSIRVGVFCFFILYFIYINLSGLNIFHISETDSQVILNPTHASAIINDLLVNAYLLLVILLKPNVPKSLRKYDDKNG